MPKTIDDLLHAARAQLDPLDTRRRLVRLSSPAR
jgi:hypothetical protein